MSLGRVRIDVKSGRVSSPLHTLVWGIAWLSSGVTHSTERAAAASDTVSVAFFGTPETNFIRQRASRACASRCRQVNEQLNHPTSEKGMQQRWHAATFYVESWSLTGGARQRTNAMSLVFSNKLPVFFAV